MHKAFSLINSTIISINALAMNPTKVMNGLAMYKIGSGEPVLVVPYPHAGTFVSIADDQITTSILTTGKSVITFDPPGAYNSTRDASVDMHEMINCINETLSAFEINEPVDMLGHSMGSLCALAYAIDNPLKVKRLVLVGCTSGWEQQKRFGVHKSWRWWCDKEFWKVRYWGTKIYLGFNNLATYNKLNNIVFEASFVDKKYVQYFPVNKGDNKRPVPTRGEWLRNVKHYDYQNQLKLLTFPVLICAGKYDVQTSLIMNTQIHEGIKSSQLVIFDKSGHFPFVEEREKFNSIVCDFLN